MITRIHRAGEMESTATYSDCERYRLALTRCWGARPRLAVVMLNPSTASEHRNDPTLARCEARARSTGFYALQVVNLFAWRATDPRTLRTAPDPVGPGNDDAIDTAAGWADAVLCAWGAMGERDGRGRDVAARLRLAGRELWHLGLTRAGAPRHPLYVATARAAERWEG